jgi:hypothetical protein
MWVNDDHDIAKLRNPNRALYMDIAENKPRDAIGADLNSPTSISEWRLAICASGSVAFVALRFRTHARRNL